MWLHENTKERKISMFEEIVTKDGLKFNDLDKKIYKFVCKLGCFIIKYILESRDRKLMEARDSKKFRHKFVSSKLYNFICRWKS